MTEAALVEGQVKLRDGKKVGARGGRGAGAGRGRLLTPPLSPQWKSRWLVLRKPSPVAGEQGAGLRRERGRRGRGAAAPSLSGPGARPAPRNSRRRRGRGR